MHTERGKRVLGGVRMIDSYTRLISPRYINLEKTLATLGRTVINKMKRDFNNCQKRCDLFSLLYICRQLYMFRV